MMRVAISNAARQRGPFREIGLNQSPSANENEAGGDQKLPDESSDESTSDCSPSADVVAFNPLGLSNYAAFDLEDPCVDDLWVDLEDDASVDHSTWHGRFEDVAKPSKDPSCDSTVLFDGSVVNASISTWEFGAAIFDS